MLRDSPGHTGNEVTLDIHKRYSGKDIEIQNNKYMPFVMNILSICHVHHLRTEMEGKPMIMPKSTPRHTNQASPTT